MRPALSYFVCGTNRSGTSFLTGLLKSTGIAGRPEEYFWRGDEPGWRERWGVATYAEYVAAALREGTTPNGVFGAKLMAGYAGEFFDKLRAALGRPELADAELLASVFPHPQYVWIRRNDVVAQAVSFSKAVQTGIWYAEHSAGPPRAARFSRDQIEVLRREIESQNEAWGRWFGESGIHPLAIVYEELEADPVAQTRLVLEFLGLDHKRCGPIEPQTTRQRDELNAEWVRRYRAGG